MSCVCQYGNTSEDRIDYNITSLWLCGIFGIEWCIYIDYGFTFNYIGFEIFFISFHLHRLSIPLEWFNKDIWRDCEYREVCMSIVVFMIILCCDYRNHTHRSSLYIFITLSCQFAIIRRTFPFIVHLFLRVPDWV